MQPTLEAREHLALRALSRDADAVRARVLDEPEAPAPTPDTDALAADVARAWALDPALGALLADAYLAGRVRRARLRYETSLRRDPVVLRGETRAFTLDTGLSAMVIDGVAARRDALAAALDDAALSRREAARDAVEALRDGCARVGDAAVEALGVAPVDDAVLRATDDLFREVDRAVCRGLSLDAGALRWGDRVRSLAGLEVLRAVPSATWSELGARWWVRLGLGHALRGVRGALRPPTGDAVGVFAAVTEPGERAVVFGRPWRAVWGAFDVLGAVSLAAGSTLAAAPTASRRRGLDRSADGALRALGRRMLLSRTFLAREAGVDGASRERVMLEALHAELARVRLDAVLSRFAWDALHRASDLGARFVDGVTRALGASPSPAWGAHVCVRSFDLGGAWGARWGAAHRGSVEAARVSLWLREQFDEDWHRNPRAGVGLTVALSTLRDGAAGPWRGPEPDDGRDAARWFGEVWRDVTR